MSQKPAQATEEEKKKRKRKKKTKQTITRTVTPIRLIEANPGKLDALDQLVVEYLALTQQYMTLFTTQAQPNRYAEPMFEATLSQRWHRRVLADQSGKCLSSLSGRPGGLR